MRVLQYDNAGRCRRYRMLKYYNDILAKWTANGGDPAPLRLPHGWTDRNYYDGLAIMRGQTVTLCGVQVTGADMATGERLAGLANLAPLPSVALMCAVKKLHFANSVGARLPNIWARLPIANTTADAEYVGELVDLICATLRAEDFARFVDIINARAKEFIF